MGGCFPCFGSSNNKETGGGGGGAVGVVKELNGKDSAKDGSIAQSHHVNRVSSGLSVFPFSAVS